VGAELEVTGTELEGVVDSVEAAAVALVEEAPAVELLVAACLFANSIRLWATSAFCLWRVSRAALSS
jgi:hypothetical protein